MKYLIFLFLFCLGCERVPIIQQDAEESPSKTIIRLRINDEPKSPNGHSISEFLPYIKAGAAIWEDVGGVLELTNSASLVIECSTVPFDDYIAVTTRGGITADCDWLVYDGVTDYMVHVFAHELGHVWGLVHVPDTKAIMHGGINTTVVLQGDDLVQWFELHP